MAADPISRLEAFVHERWAVAHSRIVPGASQQPHVSPLVTQTEARHFLACVAPDGPGSPLLVVDDEGKERSDRCPRLGNESPRGYNFFEAPGRLRLETVVQWAALSRLRYEFGWPREHLVCESPDLVEGGQRLLRYEALDILLLEEPCPIPTAKMSREAVRSRVAVEAKDTAEKLDRMLANIRACQKGGMLRSHPPTEHKKCLAIEVLRPRFFLGVAAGETWRLFSVQEVSGHAALGEELADLDALHFA